MENAEATEKTYVSSFDELGAKTEISARTWISHSRKAGFPKKTGKGFDLLACLEWYRGNVAVPAVGSAKVGLAAKKEQKLDEEIAILRLKRQREERSVVSVAAVNDSALRIATQQRQLLYELLVNELPAKTEGRTLAERRLLHREAADRICGMMQNLNDFLPDDSTAIQPEEP